MFGTCLRRLIESIGWMWRQLPCKSCQPRSGLSARRFLQSLSPWRRSWKFQRQFLLEVSVSIAVSLKDVSIGSVECTKGTVKKMYPFSPRSVVPTIYMRARSLFFGPEPSHSAVIVLRFVLRESRQLSRISRHGQTIEIREKHAGGRTRRRGVQPSRLQKYPGKNRPAGDRSNRHSEACNLKRDSAASDLGGRMSHPSVPSRVRLIFTGS